MIDLRGAGSLRSIGVSNFTEAMLTRLIDETGVTPAVNQVELHPYFPQAELRAFHAEHGIRTESWSPLARRSELLQEQVLQELAEIHGVTPTQIVLRWHVQVGSTPIPKSADPDRQRENADVFGFALTDDEVGGDLRASSAAGSGARTPTRTRRCRPPSRRVLGEGGDDRVDVLARVARVRTPRCARRTPARAR